jgi:hypothetical protein
MRAFTGYPLWFGLIAAGLKSDENRDRNLVRRENYGVPFAIHNGATQAPKKHAVTWGKIVQIAPDLFEGWSRDDAATWPEWYRLSRITKAVIAVATIERRAFIGRRTSDLEDWLVDTTPVDWLYDADTCERICPKAQRRFAFGPVIYMLRDVHKLAIPVPCPGKLGFWTLPDDVERAVTAQLGCASVKTIEDRT